MKRSYQWAPLIVAVGILSMGQDQCPGAPESPFNASGTFEGTWMGTTGDDQEALACPISFVFDHDPTLNFPANMNFTGTAVIDFACITLPEGTDPIEASELNLTFFLDAAGKLQTLSATLGPGVAVVLGLDGTGADTDNDGMMDTYSGDWAYTLSIAIPNVPPFMIDGTFTVTRVPDEA